MRLRDAKAIILEPLPRLRPRQEARKLPWPICSPRFPSAPIGHLCVPSPGPREESRAFSLHICFNNTKRISIISAVIAIAVTRRSGSPNSTEDKSMKITLDQVRDAQRTAPMDG